MLNGADEGVLLSAVLEIFTGIVGLPARCCSCRLTTALTGIPRVYRGSILAVANLFPGFILDGSSRIAQARSCSPSRVDPHARRRDVSRHWLRWNNHDHAEVCRTEMLSCSKQHVLAGGFSASSM